MEINNILQTSKRKQMQQQIAEENKRQAIIDYFDTFLFTYRSRHFGFNNLCSRKIYYAILNGDYCLTGGSFLEDYIDIYFEDALDELSFIFYEFIIWNNIEEMEGLELFEVKDAILLLYMIEYNYIYDLNMIELNWY
tara:strand:- start:138 stop:548 length:411 start_codon:yes stop_codon:yes gene_type:complete